MESMLNFIFGLTRDVRNGKETKQIQNENNIFPAGFEVPAFCRVFMLTKRPRSFGYADLDV